MAARRFNPTIGLRIQLPVASRLGHPSKLGPLPKPFSDENSVVSNASLIGASCWLLVFCAGLPAASAPSPAVVDSDVCVYGATSGGVAAAVTAARLGKSVVLISENAHVGGMSSGGLGVTDRGNEATITGISGEFYSRVGKAYGSSAPVYFFEPKVAENVFWQMLREAGVRVYTNSYLAAASLTNLEVKSISMEDGTVFRARQFIDTTYECDLMAAAGVSFTVGREAQSFYAETLAGILPPTGSYTYDPYITPGLPASGLLPLVQCEGAGDVGQGDHRLQAYNFRLCLTRTASNKLPIAPPANYRESDYDLVKRYIIARQAQDGSVTLGDLIHIQTIIPNGKTDINANGELSTDFVGYNYDYTTTNRLGRRVIRQAHEDYIRGFLHFLATSPDVPLNVRTEMMSWGLAKDEFVDTGGWPHQMYVREARRMISDYVMTQHDCTGASHASDPVALGSYAMDSHGVQRIASGGQSRWEGSLFGFVGIPYGISYRSLVPKRGEARNAYCTFALSASHVAFASCRMEPVFMMTSQAAATAACFAIDNAVDAQDVDYDKLAAQLRAERQMYRWTCASQFVTNTITLDQGNTCHVSSQGTWATGANAGGWGSAYWHDGASGKGAKWVRYTPDLPTNGVYDVYAWWVAAGNRATNTPIDIVHAAGTTRVMVNQATFGSQWFKLLRTNFNAGTLGSVIVRNEGTPSGSYVIANGVQWRPVGFTLPVPPPQLPQVEIFSADPLAGVFGTNTGRFTVVRKSDAELKPLTVYLRISGSASNGLDYAMLPTVLNLPAGVVATNLTVRPIYRDFWTDRKTVQIAVDLYGPPTYTLTSLSTARVDILDFPLNNWVKDRFTSYERQFDDIAGDAADPDEDRMLNLFEYVGGTDPKNLDPDQTPHVVWRPDGVEISYWKSRDAVDVALDLQYSPDLTSWADAADHIEPLSIVNHGNRDRITLRLLQPDTPAGANAAFVRLVARRLF